MSQPYQVLARKYRPHNFHELIGQTHVSQALINAIDHNRLHHAYLFTGTRGVGKTTIARILAKCLNCDLGVTSKPCGTCSSCQAIDQGRFIDLIEIDAASRTKVEDTRELLDNVPYAPTQGRYKVYLIDEVHMLSTHSFNALLKTLEEPPAHVKFLLATTDPQKLPITIISRCLQFVLRPLTQELLTNHLSNVLTQEAVEYDDSALWQLANAAKGSVRDSLSLTDQAIAFGQGRLSQDTVNDMLGLINSADLAQLLMDIYNDNRQAVAAQIVQMRQQMSDASSVFDELSELVHKVAIVQLMPTIPLNVNTNEAKVIAQLASLISADVLQLYYEIIIKSRESIMLATTPMQSLEMCILRMLAFRPLSNRQIVKIDPDQTALTQSDDSINPSLAKLESNTQVHQPISQYVVDTSVNTDNSRVNVASANINASNSLASDDESNNNLDAKVPDDNDTLMDLIISDDDYDDIETENIDDGFEESAVNNIIVDQDEHRQRIDTTVNEQQSLDNQSLPTQPNIIDLNPESNIKISTEAAIQPVTELEVIEPLISYDAEISAPIDGDPRALLNCPPQDLTGEWTAEKWDYWVQTARIKQILGEDELAFARQGLMSGYCDGESKFISTIEDSKFQQVFDSLTAKLTEQFTNATYQLINSKKSNDYNESFSSLNPHALREKRRVLAENTAKEKIASSPVMKAIQQLDKAARVTSVKLSLDD